MSKTIIMIGACLTVLAGARAQESDSTGKQLDPVIITANKYPQKQSSTGKVISVIPQEVLSRQTGKTLAEVLNEQVGVIINGANNTLGTNLNISIRGSAYPNTLILVDGLPINDPSSVNSEFDINTFSLAQIERIEILKGSQSTLYGSEAVAGVINIITKQSSGRPLSAFAEAAAGSFGTFRGHAGFSGTHEKSSYQLSYARVQTDGISAARDESGNGNFDRDGFRQDLVQAGLTTRINSAWSINLYGKASVNKAGIDAGAFADDRDNTARVQSLQAGIRQQWKIGEANVHLNYLYNSLVRRYVNDSGHVGGFARFEKGRYEGNGHVADLYANFRVGETVSLLLGADYRRSATSQRYLSISDFGPFESLPLSPDTANTNQYSAYGTVYTKLGSHLQLEGGLRWNRHSVYGSNLTWSAHPSWVSGPWKTFANLSTGFRVPSLYQLFSEYGNRSLEPERSLNSELGVEWKKRDLMVRVVGFQRRIEDVFIFYTDFNTWQSFYKNEDRQDDWGIETELSWQFTPAIRAVINYTYVTGELSTTTPAGKDTSFNNLYRRPAHTGNLDLGWQVVKPFYVSLHIRAAGPFLEPIYGQVPREMPGYVTVDLHADYKLGKHLQLFGDLRNLTDQDYQDILGFNTRPFHWLAGARWVF